MDKTENKIFNTKILLLFLEVFFCTLFLGATTINHINTITPVITKGIRYICYAFFVLYFFHTKKKKKQISITFVALLIISVLCFLFSKNMDILILLFILYNLRNINKEILFKRIFYIYLSMFILVVLLSFVGILPDWIFWQGKTIRHSYGFIFSTDIASVYLMIILLYCYLKKDKGNIILLLAFELFNIFLMNNCHARMSFILITFVIAIMLLSKVTCIRKIYSKLLSVKWLELTKKITLQILPIIIMIALTFVLILFRNNQEIGIRINAFLDNRIYYANSALEEYDVSIFGKDIQWNGLGGKKYSLHFDSENYKYNFVDISYFKIMLDYGIVVLILVICAYQKIITDLYKKQERWKVFIIIILLAWSIIEPYLFDISRNVFIILFADYLLNNKNVIKKEKNEEITN